MSDEVLDVPEFLERVQDDKDLLKELLDIFADDYQKKRPQLSEAVQKNDFDAVRSIAHSLKGASGNISAKLLRQVCLKLEEMGKANNLAVAKDLLLDLDKQYAAFEIRAKEVKAQLS